MYKVLRIIFCVISVLAAASAIFIFVYFQFWGLAAVGVCVASAIGMILCKRAQEREELRKNPPPPEGDFITGRVVKDEKEDK